MDSCHGVAMKWEKISTHERDDQSKRINFYHQNQYFDFNFSLPIWFLIITSIILFIYFFITGIKKDWIF